MSEDHLYCTVYKSQRKAQTYVFVPFGSDLNTLPDALSPLLGELDKVLDVELHPERPLARAQAHTVIQHIHEQGFYIQMPPGKDDTPFTDADNLSLPTTAPA